MARRIYREAVFQASISSAGSNTTRLIERMGKDTRYISRQARVVQILGSIYLLFVAIVPAATLAELPSGVTHQWNVLIATFAGTICLLVQTGYLMILTLLATAEILAPDLYRWPESLPIRREQAGVLRLLALARELLLPLIVIVVSYPVVAGIASRSLVPALLTLPVSLTHAAATVSVIVLASWKVRSVLRSSSGSERRATTVRVLTMAGYGLGIVIIISIMQFGTNLIVSLIDSPRFAPGVTRTLSQVLALLPLPTAAASLSSSLAARSAGLAVGLPVWMPLLGTVLYALLTLVLVRSAWRILGTPEAPETAGRRGAADDRDAGRQAAAGPASPASTAAAAATDGAGAGLVARSARAAFRRQIFQTATRDTSALMTLLFPLFIPVISTASARFSGAPAWYFLYAGPIAASLLSGWLLIMGLTRPGHGAGRLEATLPLRERDRAFPRLGLAAAMPTAAAVVVALAFLPRGTKLGGLMLAVIPAISVPAGFLVKCALFGRPGRGKPIVVAEIRLNQRVLKWVVTLLVVAAVTGAYIGLRLLTVSFLAPTAATVLYLVAVVAGGTAVRMISGAVFPADR
jgi:hypothetical protein